MVHSAALRSLSGVDGTVFPSRTPLEAFTVLSPHEKVSRRTSWPSKVTVDDESLIEEGQISR